MEKSPEAFRTISEVAAWLDTPAHVLRFWESRFSQIKPVKRAGGRRYYRPADMMLLGGIKKLLHEDGLTIRGVQKILREEGVKFVSSLSPALDEGADGLLIEGQAEPAKTEVATALPPAESLSGPAPEAPMQEDAESEAAEIVPLTRRPRPEPDEAMILPGLDLAAAAPPPAPEPAEPDAAAIPSFRRHARPPLDAEPAATLPLEPAPAEPEPVFMPQAEPEPEPAMALEEPEELAAPEPVFEQAPAWTEPESEAEPEEFTLEAEPAALPEPEPEPAPPQPLGTAIAATDPDDDDPDFTPVETPPRALIRTPALRQALAADPDLARQALARLSALGDRITSGGSGTDLRG
ncbi:MerR family transcriptional regulator [Rhodovulum strictum]|uniref:MerR family transcriptional regulator n=1 Tax=Rhodovulum strictum TaxID=58314 RepID=A0A844B1L2_9RHOB|nr:MerR family transcriptional regulator [Rhodovulum strictum]MRH20256.1 MerR family transcriptional regulator [Rhodovulum strictum]